MADHGELASWVLVLSVTAWAWRIVSHRGLSRFWLSASALPLALAATAALRRADLRTRTITVKLRDSDFTTRQSGHSLPDPVETDHAVYTVALPLLRELRQRRRAPVRLLGVGLSGLIERDTPAQLGLFSGSDPVESDRDRMLAGQSLEQTLEYAPTDTEGSWSNPDSGHYGTFTPVKTFQTAQGSPCREFTQTI